MELGQNKQKESKSKDTDGDTHVCTYRNPVKTQTGNHDIDREQLADASHGSRIARGRSPPSGGLERPDVNLHALCSGACDISTSLAWVCSSDNSRGRLHGLLRHSRAGGHHTVDNEKAFDTALPRG